jgi:hypothetical protein
LINYLFIYFSGGLPAGLRFGSTGLSSPVNTGTSSSSSSSTQPSSSGSTNTGNTASFNDSNNYAGVFAQMLNMMSNQNIVCLFSFIFLLICFCWMIEYSTRSTLCCAIRTTCFNGFYES